MLSDWRKIRGLPVYTVSDEKLGKIISVIFDIDSNLVFQYEVRSRLFSGRTFLINPNQIIEWKEDRIIVEDSLLKQTDSINLVGEIN